MAELTDFQKAFLGDADPGDLRNVVLQLQQKVDALSQKYLQLESLSEITPDAGSVQIRAVDENGILRMIMSAIDLFDEFGIHAHLSGFDDNGVAQFYADATNGGLTAGGGEVTLDADGVTIRAADGGVTHPNIIKWIDPSNNLLAYVFADRHAGGQKLNITQQSTAGENGFIQIVSGSGSGATLAEIDLLASDNVGFGGIAVISNSRAVGTYPTGSRTLLDAGDFTGLMVGNGGNATAPVFASGAVFGGFGNTGLKANRADVYNRVTMPIIGGNISVVTRTAQPASGTLVITLEDHNSNVYATITVAAGAAAQSFTAALSTPSIPKNALLCVRFVNNSTTVVSAQIGGISLNFAPNV